MTTPYDVPLAGTTASATPPGAGSTAAPYDVPLAASAPAGTETQRDALAQIKSILARYGLPPTLADWAWEQILAGRSSAEVALELPTRPEYQEAFPEIEARRRAGLAAISAEEIISYRRTAAQLMRERGYPTGFYDSKSDFTDLLVKDVSLKELGDRLDFGLTVATRVPQQVRDVLGRDFGVNLGDLAAWALDADRALPLLESQFAKARYSAAAETTGFGRLTAAQRTMLFEQGVSAEQAQQGLEGLAGAAGLFNPLLGTQETAIGADEQLAATFTGSATAKERITRRQSQRRATFEGGGQYATTQEGVTGLR